MNSERYSVFSPNVRKYGSEKTPYLDTFHAVLNINSNQSNVNDINITDNAHVKKSYSVFENRSENKGNPSENVKHENRSGKPNLDFNKRNQKRK